MSEGEATFRISIDGNASVATKDIAANARLAAKSIADYENEVKTLSADLRRLRGNSDEVAATKAALKKRIDEAKTSASALTIELNKQGTSYGAASAALKKYGDGLGKLPNLRRAVSKGAGAAAGAAGGLAKKAAGAVFAPIGKAVGSRLAPLGARIAKFTGGARKSLGSFAAAAKEDVGSLLPALGSGLRVLGSGAALAGGAVIALGAAYVTGAVKLAAFTLANSDAYAKMQRQRMALGWSAEAASNFGDQINALAAKVPQGTAELAEMARELSKTRLSGKAAVDTLNAVAQVSGAVDAGAGAKIQEILTRGHRQNRVFLNQLELEGTGINFDEIAKEYAAGAKKGIDDARTELMQGAVSIDQASGAIRKVVERKFGSLNLADAFSLENAPKKILEQIKFLSKGVDLGPLGKAFQDAFGQLAPEAPLGRALKTFFESFGGGIVDIAARAIPMLVEGFTYLVGWGLKLTAHFLRTKREISEAFEKGDWIGLGIAIVKGIALGLLKNPIFMVVKGIADDVIDGFKGKLDIHSPSKVFDKMGQQTTEGYAQGVERGSRRAQASVESMVGASAPRAAGNAAPPAGDHIEVHIHGAPTSNMQEMRSPSFMAQLTRAIRDARTMRDA